MHYLSPSVTFTMPYANIYLNMLSIHPALKGSIYTVVLAFPLASLLALFYRFPMPFFGYASGINAAIWAPSAVLFYGTLGGFAVLAVLGAFAGLIGSKLPIKNLTVNKTIIVLAILIDLVFGVLLATWDKIYGPW